MSSLNNSIKGLLWANNAFNKYLFFYKTNKIAIQNRVAIKH